MTQSCKPLPPQYLNRCEFVETMPVYAKTVGNIRIDPSEYTHPDGAHIMDREIHCKLVRDSGEKYCPRHKAIFESQVESAKIEFEPQREV